MRQVLTDTFVRSLKPPASGRMEVNDLRCAGLVLRLTPNGSQSWCWRFRDPATAKTTRATIGKYPAISIAQARSRAEALRREVQCGSNPVAAKRRAREDAESKTFAALAERYLTEHARRRNRPRTVDVNERTLRLHVLPKWGDRPYGAIARRDVIALAEGLVAAGKPALANRAQALVSSVYSYAIDADLIGANPAARLRKRGVERRKTRVLSDDEIRLLWARCVLPPVSRPVGLALRLAFSPACGPARSPGSPAPRSSTSTILSAPR